VTRAILDVNLLISYLLKPTGDSPPARVVRGAVTGAFVLMVSPQLLRELNHKVTTKPYLANRIADVQLDRFVQRLTGFAELHDDANIRYPRITRDRKDDYLVTNAVVHQADYLVTGDQDLLVLGEFEGVRIVSPAAFVELLDD
jgi:putative PIN family toxin of toxin-antitoxin system